MEDKPSRDFLLLSLLGTIGRAPPLPFEYLALRDRMQLLLVSKKVNEYLREVEYTHCRDGRLYRVPFPGFPGLLQSSTENAGLFPHQLASLQAMHKAENSETHYGALRGGILADAPGLGKTITMLAMIASTAGRRPQSPPEFWDPHLIDEGWKTLTRSSHFQSEILATLRPFRGLVNLYPQLAKDLRPPFRSGRFQTIRQFELYVKRFMKEYATEAELEQFRQNVLHLKAGLDKSHRKIMKSEAGRRMAWERSLFSTSATLLIVPDALLEHWFQQIHQHLNRALFADCKETLDNSEGNLGNEDGLGVVYIDGVGDIADARVPLGNVSVGSMDVPAPWELSKYLIVVTTFTRCERDFRKEVIAGRMAGGSTSSDAHRDNRKRKEYDENWFDSHSSEHPPSPLLRMRWLRITVDEGHELSNHESSNGLTRFVNQMAAERRWVLSGTPTTGNEDDNDYTGKALDQLQRLLLFLRHPRYGTLPTEIATSSSPSTDSSVCKKQKENLLRQKTQAKEEWKTQVKEPFLRKRQNGRDELLKLLRSVMVMHRKEDIYLPKPIFRQIEVDVPIPEAVQCQLQQNVQSSSRLLREYLNSDEFQSLVDQAQGEYIVEAVRRAKRALQERGGPLKDSDAANLQMMSAPEGDNGNNNTLALANDRRPVKAVVYSSHTFNLRDVTEALYKSLDRENIAEAYDDPRYDCGPELSRFRNDRKECRYCPICGHQNDVVDSASFSRNRRGEPQCQNILLEVVLRDDPSVRFLIEADRISRAIPVIEGGNVPSERLNGAFHSQYGSLTAKSWKVGDILEIDVRDPHPLLKQRESSDVWTAYGSEKCVELAQKDQFVGKDWFFGPLPQVPIDGAGYENGGPANDRPDYITEAVLCKWQKCSQFHSPRRWFQGPRLSHAPLQTIEEDVCLLSLDAGLSHGLDLSFVTHMFLLEPVDDAALLEQITSRAHRLGATGPVTVETVNPFYKLGPASEAAVEMSMKWEKEAHSTYSMPSKSGTLASSINKKDASLTQVVCQYCYRQFTSMSVALDHENKVCPRNPSNINVVDPWHLSSVYREIRPPPPRAASTR